jgi:two-component system, NtrC family, nitrogen regulation sensor histidine kinase NtrY
MKIQNKYILFVAIVHAVALVLSYQVIKENKWLFLIAEVFILISIYISYRIYQGLIKPLRLLVQGSEAMADRDFNVKLNETGSYEMDKLITVYNNMMDHLREERIKQEEQHYFLEKLIFTSPTGIMILDFDGRLQQINPAALRLLNLDEQQVLNQPLGNLSHTVFRKIKQMDTGTSATIRPDALSLYKIHKSQFVDRGFPRHFVMMEVLTTEILEAEKGVYGKVIRMMAHEVNNTIGPVNSIMHSALQTLPESSGQPIAVALQVAIDRNNNLNIFMRNFAELVRLPVPARVDVDLVRITNATIQLMQMRVHAGKIRFVNSLPEHPFMIYADPQQLEQVLINIVKNAMEAIEGDGTIKIEADLQKRRLIISDSGKGISDEISSKIFEPFFSTKKDGQGIGLALIREILSNHQYSFSLQSPGNGWTCFTIQF